MLVCWLIGRLISRTDPVTSRLSKYERIGVSILIGQSALTASVFVYGSLIGIHSLVGLFLIGFIILFAFWLNRAYGQSGSSLAESTSERPMNSRQDVSFATSISRRMIGLLVLAITLLTCIQVYGATIPSHDMDVREVQWWKTKHAALDGRIRWYSEHAKANAPDSFNLPALAISSLLTIDLPLIPPNAKDSIQIRERWNRRLRVSVLAGKTVNAMLCLVGVVLCSVHVGRRWGYLSGLFVCFLLVATPGVAELTRLGRTEALTGIWSAALLVVWQASRNSSLSKSSLGVVWGFLLAGAFSSGYGSAVLVGLPAAAFWVWSVVCREPCGMGVQPVVFKSQAGNLCHIQKRRAICRTMLVCAFVAASAFYLRNVVASGDPFYPWGSVIAQKVGLLKGSELSETLLYAYRVPSETISELIAEADSTDSTASNTKKEIKSPFRLSNFLDGVLRLSWNSSSHGLMLVPFAIVGMLRAKCWSSRLAVLWYVYWISIWWCFSIRFDRDWVGALLLLAWPAAAGANWMAGQARGYWMMSLCSIAILWSIVVIPVLPTMDNRLFVALNVLDRNRSPLGGSSRNSDEMTEPTSISEQLNVQLRKEAERTPHLKILLVGENDDFDFLADCVSNGPFDKGLLDKWLGLPAKEMGSSIRTVGFSHVLIVWSGVQYRERLTGRPNENKYRTAIGELLSESQIVPIPWEINSSQAELFRVIK